MTRLGVDQWRDHNDRVVSAGVAWVRALLMERLPKPLLPPVRRPTWWSRWFRSAKSEEFAQAPEMAESAIQVAERLALAEADLVQAEGKSALAELAQRFGLNEFETDVLLLCLAFELDTRIGGMCAAIQGDSTKPFPTFGLAMSVFGAPEWLALLPEKPLRQFKLIECRLQEALPLLATPIAVEECVLHYLRGVASLDARLRTVVTPALDVSTSALSVGQREAVARIVKSYSKSPIPVVQMLGSNATAKSVVAVEVSRQLNCQLYRAPVTALPANAEELKDLVQRWRRDSRLHRLALAIDIDDAGVPGRHARLAAFAGSPLFLLTAERVADLGDADLVVEIPSAGASDQYQVWNRLLPAAVPSRRRVAGELARQFEVAEPVARQAITAINGCPADTFFGRLWNECREQNRPRLEGLAERIDCKAGWDDLILNPDRRQLLEQIRGQMRSRWRVYDDWGLAERMNRGLGVTALFAGESGTGKTMAAEVLARDLDLDLYRVDLSSVVNKYIGETEKHLAKLFSAFESCGAILFFDECDALFGKRSEVKDSHDRYANIEINYLLQRIESYRGLAILATNKPSSLDTAFLRRLRFVVRFAPPTVEERKKIWKRLLPPSAAGSKSRVPVAKLDYERLAAFTFTGGNIHSVSLNATFRAAQGEPPRSVGMADVLAAVRDEHIKLERIINESEYRWVDEPAAEVTA